MFEQIRPEQAGVPSKVITSFINMLDKIGAHTHGILFMRDGKIFAEGYYKPFDKDFCHRMYSQTKSFVGVAIGLLEEEGKLSLDDRIIDYFPDRIDSEVPEYLDKQTIRETLTMKTAGSPDWWFATGDPDRVHQYFCEKRITRPSGTLWEYDSSGSQVLSALVERLSGKTLLEYLKEKLFNEMGVFQTARILKTPNGESWGDSAMICTLRDMAAFGQFVMNYGVWNGKRLMNERYLREATSKITDNKEDAYYSGSGYGYGYQIWRVGGNGFAFVGMGNQITVCYPDKNFLFACISDDQGMTLPRNAIFTHLRECVLPSICDEPLGEDAASYDELREKLDSLTLFCVTGEEDSPFREKLNGAEYVCGDNPMGIKRFSFVFDGKTKGEFRYSNGQGDKTIPFGVNSNVFGKFPQYGYSAEYGGMKTTDGHTYKDAASFAWLEENKILLFVQIIDDYMGNMSAVFAFKDDYVSAVFTSVAENFLSEYKGYLTARKINK